MITTYNIRVGRGAYGLLHAAVARGSLRGTGESVSGLRGGQVYWPPDARLSAQAGVHEHALRLGDWVLPAELWRLPTPELTALVQGSPGYCQHPALPLIAGAVERADRRAWWARLEALVAAGRQGGLRVQRAPGTVTAPGVWQPGETRLTHLGGEWFVTLAFALGRFSRGPGPRRAVGVDVGLQPLCVVASAGDVLLSPPCSVPAWETRPAGCWGPEHQAAYLAVQAAAARACLEPVTRHLLAGAWWVAVEDLDLRTFASDFPARGRELAVVDWLLAELPQRLHAARIPKVAVEPAWASRQCSRCGSRAPGQRRGKVFRCERCGHEAQADVNAARNHLRRGHARRGSRRRPGGAG